MHEEHIIAIMKMTPIKITDDIFISEEEKELFYNSSKEEQRLFLFELVDDLDKDFEIDML